MGAQGIKAIRIPIPGTSKSISCTISILRSVARAA
jgi:hypothetical protein